MKRYEFTPDYNNVVKAARNIKPDRLPLYEHLVGGRMMTDILGINPYPLMIKNMGIRLDPIPNRTINSGENAIISSEKYLALIWNMITPSTAIPFAMSKAPRPTFTFFFSAIYSFPHCYQDKQDSVRFCLYRTEPQTSS